MKLLCLCGLIAFIISVLMMPLVVSLSRHWGAVSETGGRNVGSRPIGRLGGIGVVFGIIVAVVILLTLQNSVESATGVPSNQIIGLIVGTLLVGGVGFLDDIHRLPAKLKLAVQVLAAAVAYFTELALYSINLPFLGPLHLGWFAFPVTAIWIVGVVNAVNLIDGLDGLAGGAVMFASIVNFVAAITNGSVFTAGIMAAVAGAVLGFLVYNWYPAKIYLGDGGAYSLGYLLATSALLSPHEKASNGVELLVPILAAGLPIFDTLLTVIRRALKRRGIFTPDRGHLHHVLLDAGISHLGVVIGLYTLSWLFASIAVAIVLNRNRETGYWLMAVSLFAFAFWCFRFRNYMAFIGGQNHRKEGPKRE